MGRHSKVEKMTEKSGNSPVFDESSEPDSSSGKRSHPGPIETTYRGGRQYAPKSPPVLKKRGRPSRSSVSDAPAKKIKLDFRHSRGSGNVLTIGCGDTGQLGLGEDVMEKTRPGVVSEIPDAVDIVAGGMHTVCLNKAGEVWTFGCNDEGALGRPTPEEEETFIPGKVEIDGKVVQISGGDSHSAALTEDGKVFAWGTFRDSSGPIGLVKPGEPQTTPLRVLEGVVIKKICSGEHHMAMLTVDGEIYSFGNAEQGQLGRVSAMFSQRGGRRGLDMLLQPEKIHLSKKSTTFTDVWAGNYDTFAMTSTGEMLVMGLNNYNQLGVSEGLTFFMPTLSPAFTEKKWQQISVGQHHVLGLDDKGKVYAIGRSDYGRLGLGSEGDRKVPTLVPSLADMTCVEVACGSTVSFAVSEDGACFSWGMGTNSQLGTGNDEDVLEPHNIKSKALETRSVICASSGGQHTVLIAKQK